VARIYQVTVVGAAANGRVGETVNGKVGETVNGKVGETVNGRVGETVNGRAGEMMDGGGGATVNGGVEETVSKITTVKSRYPRLMRSYQVIVDEMDMKVTVDGIVMKVTVVGGGVEVISSITSKVKDQLISPFLCLKVKGVVDLPLSLNRSRIKF
jgi:hypothetical protein